MDNDRTERRDPADLFQARHHPAEIVFGITAFLFATWLLTQLGSQTKFVANAPLTKQPGLWPAIAIIGMIAFGALEIVLYWRRNRGLDRARLWPELAHWARALEYLFWFMAYVLLVPRIGYLPATVLLCVLLVGRRGYRGLPIFMAAAGAGVGTVVVFKSLLQVKIPGGAVYEYLPAGLRNFMILYF